VRSKDSVESLIEECFLQDATDKGISLKPSLTTRCSFAIKLINMRPDEQYSD